MKIKQVAVKRRQSVVLIALITALLIGAAGCLLLRATSVKADTNEAPAWVGPTYTELENTDQDVSYQFTYGGARLSQDTLSVCSAFMPSQLRSGTPLVPGEDFTLSYDETAEEYTLTLTKEYLASPTTFTKNNNGLTIGVTIDGETIVAQLYKKQTTEGWYARLIDLQDEDPAMYEKNEYYTYVTMSVHVQQYSRSHLYYNEPIDVTKPIYLEFNSICDSVKLWGLLQVSDTLSTMDYFSNETMEESKLQALFFTTGDPSNAYSIQKLYGFEQSTSTNVTYGNAAKDRTLVEIYFGKTKEESYMRINGVDCGHVEAVQDDFTDKTAYIGWFFANGNPNPDPYVFRPNSHVNALAIVDPIADAAFKMDIGAPTDFALTLKSYEAGDKIIVKDDSGEALAKNTDYTFDAATGVLTLKAAYFARLPFVKQGTISLWNETAGNGTQFSMEYSSSDMHDAQIFFRTVDATADIGFTMPGAAEITSVLDANGEDLEAAVEGSVSNGWKMVNGKLVLPASFVGSETGIYEFIAVSGRDLYPLYVYTDDFTDGGLQTGGDGRITHGYNVYVLRDDVNYMFARTIDLANGTTFKVDFKSIPGYYEFGNTVCGYVTLDFYDPYSGNTVSITIYANYGDENVSSAYTALYIGYKVINSDGKTVSSDDRSLNIANSANPSALGVHSVKLAAKNGDLVVTVDNARDLTIAASDLGGFRMSACVCSVNTPAGTQNADMELGIVCFDGKATINYDALDKNKEEFAEIESPVDPTPPDSPDPEKPDSSEDGSQPAKEKGCNSTVGGGFAVLGTVSVLLACCIFVFRKRTDVK